MRKIDPQLEFLLDGGSAQLATTGNVEATFERFGLESVARSREEPEDSDVNSQTVTVLVQYSGDPADLQQVGLNIRSISGDVVTGTIPLGEVRTLSALPEVERMEASRSMQIELDLSRVECRADQVHVGPPGRRGAGVIVGICDSGCDFTHQSFRRPDGTSRILFIWDQALVAGAGESAPSGFGYGVEYGNAQINAALASGNPFGMVRHRDAGGHGTHVTGIAAGDGSVAGQGQPGGTFVGIAPEAEIIVVANASNGAEGLGTSASTLDAVNYIFQRATTLTRPCVVNMSLGDNLGPHDGTSLLERGLDNLLGGAGRAFVKSAGNAGAARCHAEGTVVAGATLDLLFNQPAGDNGANQIDLWYRGTDAFRVSVLDPTGNAVGPANVGAVANGPLPGGNTVRIDHRNADPFNGDRRVFMTFAPGTAGTMAAGNWTIRIVGVTSSSGGRFDAWIQRGAVVPSFLAPHESQARTISTPGTAREVITAANYVTRGAGVGSLASSSSRGPTRDGRAAPTVAAPGMLIMSADGESSGGDSYRLDGGTSMAAPHVTGTIALMLQKSRTRTQDQIKACLESSARSDAQTGPVPNTAWGAGKLDANAAVNCVPGLIGPTRSIAVACPSVPRTTCPTASVTTVCRPSVPRLACVDFPSVAAPCLSVPAVTCGGGQSVLSCPSVVDGCPSTPGGCIQSIACGPQSVACGGPVQSIACGGPLQSVACGGPGPGVLRGGIGGGGVEGHPQWGQMPEGWDAPGPAPESTPQQPPVPPQGYFDYDEGWFNDDGR